jgi:hypothetical protein
MKLGQLPTAIRSYFAVHSFEKAGVDWKRHGCEKGFNK